MNEDEAVTCLLVFWVFFQSYPPFLPLLLQQCFLFLNFLQTSAHVLCLFILYPQPGISLFLFSRQIPTSFYNLDEAPILFLTAHSPGRLVHSFIQRAFIEYLRMHRQLCQIQTHSGEKKQCVLFSEFSYPDEGDRRRTKTNKPINERDSL